ncbi:V-type ATP synthase subunit I [Sulfurovum riftiae]|uniref:Uncharacterized protein n=1 Tax=Sulfurovum riftiae TaxID=1630136 RepID=A0A151CH08_9BACT|nr:V-type ATPase 116kDa subunit family protein [Sulfurovum riftiae]KYJ86543.1 hypothetical protein AS592_06995 [Sulfurovum riftiae]
MFFPEKMLHVRIEIEAPYSDEVIENIGHLGYLHIDSKKNFLHNESEESRVHTLLTLVRKYMSELGISHHRAGTFSFSNIEKLLDETEEELQQIGTEIDEVLRSVKETAQESKRFEQAASVKKALLHIIDVESLARELGCIRMRLGITDMESAELLRLALKHEQLLVIDAAVFEKTSAVAVLYEEGDAHEVTHAFGTLKVSEIPLEYCLDEAFIRHRQREEAVMAEKENLVREHAAALQRMEKVLYELYALEKAKSSLEKSEKGMVLEGWIPANVSEAFTKRLKHAVVTFLPSIGEAPVLLETPPALKPFEKLITNFSYPRYGEVNPVIPFAFSFLLLFGIMFGDVGHGAVLALLGGLVKKYKKEYADLGQVYYLSGLSSILFGFLYGSVFGVHHLLPHILFTPIENIEATILFSIGIGIGIITLSFLLHMVTAVKRKEPSLLFLSEGSLLWFLVYWFAIGIFVKSAVQHMDTTYEVMILFALLASILYKMLIQTAEKTQAVIDFFRTFMETITNTVSFLRVGAFALAHGALFMAVFSIAKMISESYGEGFWYWLLIIVGNVVIIVLEGVIVTIQTLRLEYYEFFKRFFKGGGTPYRPYRLGEKNDRN